MLLGSTLLVFLSSGIRMVAHASKLEARVTPKATCTDDTLLWTYTKQGVSPCDLAGTVQGACESGSNTLQPLLSNSHYNIPGETSNGSTNTPNVCSCSWAAYNLFSACEACQGFPTSIQTWSAYKDPCKHFLLDQFFSPDIALPSGTVFPDYATQDPTTWTTQIFNVTQAKAIADKGLNDVSPPPQVEKKTSLVGPIVGGVVGGVAAILLAVGIAYFMVSRRRKRYHENATAYAEATGHGRTKSDASQASGIGLGYARIQSPHSFATTQMTHAPSSPTMHTHTSSVNSLSYFGSIAGSAAYMSSPPPVPHRQLSPPPNVPVRSANREDIIIPYTLHPQPSHETISRQHSSSNLADRKRPDGSIVRVYDPPTAPPPAMYNDTPSHEITSRRPRLNPPAYTPSQQGDTSPQAISPRSRPPHSKKGSSDTQHSWDSSGSGATTRPGGGGGSVSTIGEIIGQMGLGTETVSGSGTRGTVATGQSSDIGTPPRQQPQRPTIANPDGVEIHNNTA